MLETKWRQTSPLLNMQSIVFYITWALTSGNTGNRCPKITARNKPRRITATNKPRRLSSRVTQKGKVPFPSFSPGLSLSFALPPTARSLQAPCLFARPRWRPQSRLWGDGIAFLCNSKSVWYFWTTCNQAILHAFVQNLAIILWKYKRKRKFCGFFKIPQSGRHSAGFRRILRLRHLRMPDNTAGHAG